MTKLPKRHRIAPPVAVPLLLMLCLFCGLFFSRPAAVSAQEKVVVTRIREFYPEDAILPETEVYYPQITFGGNPSQLQTANAMMREYAIGQYHLYRQQAKSGGLNIENAGNLPVNIADYQILRNGGGYFSVRFRSENASLAKPGCFTVRLSDRKICRLADLFAPDTDYCALLNRELSRQQQTMMDKVRFDTPFCLTDDALLLVIREEGTSPTTFEVPLSAIDPRLLRL